MEASREGMEMGKYGSLPTEHTKNQVEHKKGANQDECSEVDPRPFHSNSIIYLSDHQCNNTLDKNVHIKCRDIKKIIH